MAAALAGQRVSGSVRKFQGTFGFLISDAFQGDIFVGTKANPHLGRLLPDDKVDFEIEVRGSKAEAVNVTLLDSPGGNASGEQSDGQRYFGWVKSFRGDWGFINSDAMQGDIFVGLKKNRGLSTLHQDDQVEFEIMKDDRGKSEAINVHVLQKVPGAGDSAPSVRAVASTGGGRANVGHLVGQKLVGKIKSFKENWGFIVSDHFAGDLFVHLRSNVSLQGVRVDDMVTFHVEQDPASKDGGYHAVGTTLFGEIEPRELVGHTVQGWVKTFKGSWGFLNSHRFQGDVFVGLNANRHLGQVALENGEPVEFEIAADAKSERGVEAVKLVRVLKAGGSPMMHGYGMNQMHYPSGQYGAYGQSPGHDLDRLQGMRCHGQVRKFKGAFGFVTSDMFAGDLFIGTRSNPDLPVLQPGDQIEFTVQAAPGKSQAGFEAVHVVLGSNGGGGSGGTRNRSRSPKGQGSKDAGQFVGQMLTGWIRTFKSPWGFVNSDIFQGDLFVGTKSNPNLPSQIEDNQPVQFEVAAGKGGKFEAINVVVM